jgi:hypothetical protein
MTVDRTFYAYGETPLGFEMGQRTDTFRSDWPIRATASLYGRDLRTFTRVRQRALLVRKSLGFATLPSWMEGSSRSFLRDPDDAVPFPDTSFLHALRDAIYGTPAALLIFAARYSRDASLSLSTGIAAPRSAYRLSAVTTGLPLSLSDGRTIRNADSLWDFMTAFDPVSLPTEDGSLILRNLDAPVLHTAASVRGYQQNPRIHFSSQDHERDGNAAAIWDDARSLSDDGYLPPVMGVSPVSPGLDLSCDSLWPDQIGPWAYDAMRVAYPVPLEPSLIISDVPQATWPALTSPGFIGPVQPADGLNRLLLPGLPRTGGWAISAEGSPVGTAHLCTLVNGWDNAGELIRLPRREREDDLVYAGRQQRLWLACLLNVQKGAATREGQERTLSGALCRSVIVPTWDGSAFDLPANTTRVDALDYSLPTVVLSTTTGEISITDTSTLVSVEDLSAYRYLHVQLGEATLREGVDFVIQSGTTILLSSPMTTTDPVVVIGQQRVPYVLDSEEQPALFSPQASRQPGAAAWTGPLLISRGPRVLTAGRIQGTQLLQAGGILPTALGQSICTRPSTPAWTSLPNINAPLVAPPFDLDTGAFA